MRKRLYLTQTNPVRWKGIYEIMEKIVTQISWEGDHMSNYIYLNETTKEEVQDAIDEKLDIISQIMSEMLSDDENDTTRLLCMYQNQLQV